MKETPRRMYYRQLVTYNPFDPFPAEEVEAVVRLMLDNVITRENVVMGKTCLPGAIMASPSVSSDPRSKRNYVYDWMRDSALTMLEVLSLSKTGRQRTFAEIVRNYVSFVARVQSCDAVPLGYARWNLDATPSENWMTQNDGPALRALACHRILELFGDRDLRQQAEGCLRTDLAYILDVHQDDTFNIWEEVRGSHFFEKVLMRKALLLTRDSGQAATVASEATVNGAVETLERKLERHWAQGKGYFKSQLDNETAVGNDLNMSVVFGMLYGEAPGDSAYAVHSRRGMQTLAALIAAFRDAFDINREDAKFNLGPNIGRYPSDGYDGDYPDYHKNHTQPWFICTNAVACSFYRIARAAETDASVEATARELFSGLVPEKMPFSLARLGHRFLLATKRHWEDGRMSEQYDQGTGFLKSVRDLTWSYASYLMCANAYHALRV